MRAKRIITTQGQELRLSKHELESMYLDYYTNFLTIRYYSEYYGLKFVDAQYIINSGRDINHKRGRK
jgi:hypothetical protein